MPTCYLKHWGKKRVFAKLWKLASEEYNELVGLDWRLQSVYSTIIEAPVGCESAEKNPIDRGKGCQIFADGGRG